MKVLQLCSIYGDRFFENLINSINDKNVESYVYYPRAVGKKYSSENEYVFSVEVFNRMDRLTFFSKEAKMLSTLEKKITVKDFDIIHAHTLFTDGYQAYKLKKKYGTPYIVAVRSADLNYFLRIRKELYYVAKRILEDSDKIIFLSEPYRRRILKKYGNHLLHKTKVIPNGIDPFFSQNKFYELRNERKEINLLSVGYISKRKNQLSTCKAIELLLEEGVSVNYTIIGKILDKKIYEKLSNLSFVTIKEFMPKEKLVQEYRSADIFVMPSKFETFGLTYLESISQNLPVIYTRGEGFDEWFSEGEVGFSVESNNYKEISEKILELTKKKSNMGDISKKISDFEWDKIGRSYRQIYDETKY